MTASKSVDLHKQTLTEKEQSIVALWLNEDFVNKTLT